MGTEAKRQGDRRPLRIGKYEILGHIASGGMGAVYKAIDTDLNRLVSLKILSPALAVKPNMVERFKREARCAAQMRHENIVAIHDFGNYHGTIYLALEYVEGKDFHEHLSRKGKLDSDEACQIVIQVTRGLDHAYRKGIVHRDVKPSNVLISSRAGKLAVKLIDLGLARHESDDEFRVTKPGVTIGTVDYMSPEQARDSSKADIRSDIYSLGCTFYHALGGAPPFPGGSLAERICNHMEAEPLDIRKLNPRVPDRIAAVVHRMLAKRPQDRYDTPLDLLRELETPENFRAFVEEVSHDDQPALIREDEIELRFRPPSTHVERKPPAETVEIPATTPPRPSSRRRAPDTVEQESEAISNDDSLSAVSSGFPIAFLIWPLLMAFILILGLIVVLMA